MTNAGARQLLVRGMRLASDDVLVLDLEDPDGHPLPGWEPGAHIDLGVGDRGVRQYSLCGRPGAEVDAYRVAVLRSTTLGGGSAYVHEVMRPGHVVRASAPRNHFPLEQAERYVLIAGGIGITPILAMAEELERRGADWSLVYGGRSRSAMAFLPELERFHPRVTVIDESEKGRIDLDRWVTDQLRDGVLVYCCGPAGLLDAVTERCAGRPDLLRTERFSIASTELVAADEDAFDVECRRSGVTVTVPPDRSIVDALAGAGVTVETSCRDGICGTCETTVLAGTPDHRDYVLSTDERAAGGSMMLCVSRATSRLVLDL